MCNKKLLSKCINTEEHVISELAQRVGVDSLVIKKSISKSLSIIINTFEDYDSFIDNLNNSFTDRIVTKYINEIE